MVGDIKMLNCEQWKYVLDDIFESSVYEVDVKSNKTECNTYVRKKGTIKPKYIKIYPKQNATHIVLNRVVKEYVEKRIGLRQVDVFKGNEYHYRNVDDSFIKEICGLFSEMK